MNECEVAQSCLTLCDPVDCSLSGCSVHGIFQVRVLEWVAISNCHKKLLSPGVCDTPMLLPKRQKEARGLLTAQGLLPSLEFVSVVVIDDDPGFCLGRFCL